ncbi:MAG: hypothetical protein HZB70_02980 [Candidatus Berkelbacteria bacterium]|nr:MAG: hypothetical protein HZB70_02980 [Candidatus Berkelbacteria bacterium]QQG51731.1 MAG: hypothetical protein HY845_00015 [Candidatus Berkelbacteria bacterium]
MTARFWFYLAAVIIIAGLGSWGLFNSRRLSNEIGRLEAEAIATDQATLTDYLERQDDAFKLVGLAKLYGKTHPELVKAVVLRAFELNKDSRDIAVLASPYSLEAEERLKVLDPLYKQGPGS